MSNTNSKKVSLAKIFDWQSSLLNDDVINDRIQFNRYDIFEVMLFYSENNPKFLKDEEIEQLVETFKINHKDFKKIKVIEPYYNKTLDTLSELMKIFN